MRDGPQTVLNAKHVAKSQRSSNEHLQSNTSSLRLGPFFFFFSSSFYDFANEKLLQRLYTHKISRFISFGAKWSSRKTCSNVRSRWKKCEALRNVVFISFVVARTSLKKANHTARYVGCLIVAADCLLHNVGQLKPTQVPRVYKDYFAQGLNGDDISSAQVVKKEKEEIKMKCV